jgi:hypothetical protein
MQPLLEAKINANGCASSSLPVPNGQLAAELRERTEQQLWGLYDSKEFHRNLDREREESSSSRTTTTLRGRFDSNEIHRNLERERGRSTRSKHGRNRGFTH